MHAALPELLAPAGCFEAACAAFQYGADAVYLGLPNYSARAEAVNFTLDELTRLTAYARTFTPRKKIYLTLNTLLTDAELNDVVGTLAQIEPLQPDGIILQDLGLAQLLADHFPAIPRHASTQLAIHNTAGARELKRLGFTRAVTARELTLEENAAIARDSGLEIEIFIHGALCYSYSGLCLYSALTSGRSGNRGRCAYGCREPMDGNRYPFSMRDLALAPHIDEIRGLPIASLKIEGRMKSPLYVAAVTAYYRDLIDGRPASPDHYQTIFSRPVTTLYAGDAASIPETLIDAHAVGHRGLNIGTVTSITPRPNGDKYLTFTATHPLELHDGLQIDLPQGGQPYGFAITQLLINGRPAFQAPAHTPLQILLPADAPYIPSGAPLYCSSSQAVKRTYAIQNPRDAQCALTRPIDIQLTLRPDAVTAAARDAIITLPAQLTPAQNPQHTHAAATKAFTRATAGYTLGTLTLDDPHTLYAPPSLLNDLRRQLYEQLAQHDHDTLARKAAAVRDALEQTPIELPQLPTTPTLKLHLNQLRHYTPSKHPHATQLVIQIPHDCPIRNLPPQARLALPLITRNAQWDTLNDTLRDLIACGHTAWECADLAGAALLAQHGITDITADWTCYTHNTQAYRFWHAYGIRAVVQNPEQIGQAPAPSHIPLQSIYAPLFISQTKPCSTCIAFTDRRGRKLITQHINGLWITADHRPLNAPLTSGRQAIARTDYTYAPEGTPL